MDLALMFSVYLCGIPVGYLIIGVVLARIFGPSRTTDWTTSLVEGDMGGTAVMIGNPTSFVIAWPLVLVGRFILLIVAVLGVAIRIVGKLAGDNTK